MSEAEDHSLIAYQIFGTMTLFCSKKGSEERRRSLDGQHGTDSSFLSTLTRITLNCLSKQALGMEVRKSRAQYSVRSSVTLHTNSEGIAVSIGNSIFATLSNSPGAQTKSRRLFPTHKRYIPCLQSEFYQSTLVLSCSLKVTATLT